MNPILNKKYKKNKKSWIKFWEMNIFFTLNVFLFWFVLLILCFMKDKFLNSNNFYFLVLQIM